MAQNNDSPGKRLKREEKKNNILYVNRPDDPRLQMYQDSLEANKVAQGLNREIAFMNTMTPQDRYKYYDNKYGRLNMWSGNGRSQRFLNKKQLDKSYEAEKRLFQATKQPFTKEDKTIRTDIIAPSGTYFEVSPERPGGTKYSFPEYGLKENPPKRPVVFRPEPPIEPLAPRQATLTPQEIIAPVPRPVDVPPVSAMKEPMMEEEVVTERPVARKPPKAVMPRRAGGWSNQPLLMQLFPKLYER